MIRLKVKKPKRPLSKHQSKWRRMQWPHTSAAPLPPPAASVMSPNDHLFNQMCANAQGQVAQHHFNSHFGHQNRGAPQCDVNDTACQLESKLDPKSNDNAFQWNGQLESKLDPTNNACAFQWNDQSQHQINISSVKINIMRLLYL